MKYILFRVLTTDFSTKVARKRILTLPYLTEKITKMYVNIILNGNFDYDVKVN